MTDHGEYSEPDQGTSWAVATPEPIMEQTDDQGWPIMEDQQRDQGTDTNDDHVSDSDVSDQQRYSLIIITMIDHVQHKIEDAPQGMIELIFKWLGEHTQSSACKIEIPSEDDLQQTLTIMRDKIVSIETYSSPMGGG